MCESRDGFACRSRQADRAACVLRGPRRYAFSAGRTFPSVLRAAQHGIHDEPRSLAALCACDCGLRRCQAGYGVQCADWVTSRRRPCTPAAVVLQFHSLPFASASALGLPAAHPLTSSLPIQDAPQGWHHESEVVYTECGDLAYPDAEPTEEEPQPFWDGAAQPERLAEAQDDQPPSYNNSMRGASTSHRASRETQNVPAAAAYPSPTASEPGPWDAHAVSGLSALPGSACMRLLTPSRWLKAISQDTHAHARDPPELSLDTSMSAVALGYPSPLSSSPAEYTYMYPFDGGYEYAGGGGYAGGFQGEEEEEGVYGYEPHVETVDEAELGRLHPPLPPPRITSTTSYTLMGAVTPVTPVFHGPPPALAPAPPAAVQPPAPAQAPVHLPAQGPIQPPTQTQPPRQQPVQQQQRPVQQQQQRDPRPAPRKRVVRPFLRPLTPPPGVLERLLASQPDPEPPRPPTPPAVPREPAPPSVPAAAPQVPAANIAAVPAKRPRGRPRKHPVPPPPALTKEARYGYPKAEPGTTSTTERPAKLARTKSGAGAEEIPGQSTFHIADDPMPLEPKAEEGKDGAKEGEGKKAEKKKPVMACLFCRERKIACGPLGRAEGPGEQGASGGTGEREGCK